ncbi:hypothetical protein BSLG_008895 [Batrachochytrium salamandrivorans]|nr:hypothetical protein BSLG_008895 [Batrachochytrium salamandrivorans]
MGTRPANLTGSVASHLYRFGHPGPTADYFVRDAYALSYNRASRNAHWVAEHLTKESLAHSTEATQSDNGLDSLTPDRSRSKFKEEDGVPARFRSKLTDYSKSGFDRGHLVPAADVRESQKAVDETFMLSNISPQAAKGFNRGYWAYFENFVRSLTDTFDNVFVTTGPLFLPTKDENGQYWVKYQVLGTPPNTAVPTHFFKVIVATRKDQTYAQAFVVPNSAIEGTPPLTDYIVPVDAVEHMSGLSLFPNLDAGKLPSLCGQTTCDIKTFRQSAKAIGSKG